MIEYPKLYKRTSTGAIQTWWAEVNGSQYRTHSGQLDGKIVTSSWTQAESTNDDRANYRSPEEQAIFQVEAIYKKRQEKDYHSDINNIDNNIIFECMLAKEYEEKRIKRWPVYSQPKLDGMRCIATKDGLFSRGGKRIVSVPHIMEHLQSLFDRYPGLVLDGELYNHDYKEDFDTIMSNTKKLKPTDEDFVESSKVIQYHVYDCPSCEAYFINRYEFLEMLFEKFCYVTPDSPIKFVDTIICNSFDDIEVAFNHVTEQGYEGLMVRLNEYEYENKRSQSLMKYKLMMDEEFELVDILPGKGNYAHCAKIAKFKLPDGRIFGAGVAGAQERNIEILKNKDYYIGTMCTVQFQNYTPKGKPRMPVVKEFNRTDV